MNKKILYLSLFFLTFDTIYSQNRDEMLVYNLGLGAITSGIGAIINNESDDSTGKVFINGFWKGMIGGYLVYESKNIIGEIQSNEKISYYGWSSKLLNSCGVSIIENGAKNRNPWEKWILYFGFNRFELSIKDRVQIKYKIMPVSFFLTTYNAVNSKFEFKHTLQAGEFIFSKKKLPIRANGYTLGNSIVLKNTQVQNYSTISHELIHSYQYYDYNFVNSFTYKIENSWKKNSKIFNNFSKIFYFDRQLILLRPLYIIEGGTNNSYYFDNFFEYEAEFFSSNGKI